MGLFVWNMAISFQLLFFIVSGVIFIYIREKSFKYYAFYNIFLGIYILSRNDDYYYGFENFMARFLSQNDAVISLTSLVFFCKLFSIISIADLRFIFSISINIPKNISPKSWGLCGISEVFSLVGQLLRTISKTRICT